MQVKWIMMILLNFLHLWGYKYNIKIVEMEASYIIPKAINFENIKIQ